MGKLNSLDMHISTGEARNLLFKSGEHFAKLFNHGTLGVEIYRPDKIDHQQPHAKDEVYIIISGEGDFFLQGKVTAFKAVIFYSCRHALNIGL